MLHLLDQSEKLDLPHLRHDIPRYSSSNMSSEAIQWWNSFVDEIERSMDATSHVMTTWTFQELVEVILESQTALTTQETQQDDVISDRLLQMRGAETDSIPEVPVF